MTTELEKLPRLIQRAIAVLEKATTAAEILEAKEQANMAYEAAKITARLSKIKDAHETVIAACRKTQADALMIEARAQIRLADEYDAAQERGEVQKGGRPKNKTIPNENSFPTVIDIGLTSKQVHEARNVRDAENAKPGVIRKVLDKQLEDGEEPTRAVVKRAIKDTIKKPSKPRKPRERTIDNRDEQIVAMEKEGLSRSDIAAELDVTERTVRRALDADQLRQEGRDEPVVDRAELSLTAQQKFDLAVKQHQRKLDLAFEQRVRDEVKRRIDEIVLPHWKEKIEKAQKLYVHRRGAMAKETFNTIRRALHPDSRQSISDKKLGEAFDTFMGLEKFLLDEKDSPTDLPDLPDNLAAWDRAKQQHRRNNRHSKTAVRRR